MTTNDPRFAAFAEGLTHEDRTALLGWLDTLGHVASAVRGEALPLTSPAEWPRPAPDDPEGIRTVGVIGGGTAGYLTALALRASRPWLEVSLVESSGIPIIGVGEATTPSMVPFLHHYLGIDAAELYERVRPTWKLGIRFDWGPFPDGFTAPFDWHSDSVGVLGSLAEHGDPNGFTLLSLLMMADRVPVYRKRDGDFVSLMKHLPFAYHLDNRTFVRYLTELAEARGVKHVDAVVADVEQSSSDWVDGLRLGDGRVLRYDFYVDCTGFRSLLLGKSLGSAFRSYADSLFTDTAVTGVRPHGGHLKPYTTAATMDGGWCWTIPTPESDHHGYVHSSAHISVDEATDELTRRFPDIDDLKVVRFRSGRHDHAWRGNVMAIGNSYAFVEPLESSGLMMIKLGILTLVSAMPATWREPNARDVVNAALSKKWDDVRWFLSLHYRFNTRSDSAFWRDCRDRVDVSGMRPLLSVFSGGAPLRLRDRLMRDFLQSTAPTFFGLEGIDCILIGQGQAERLVTTAEPVTAWRSRRAAAEVLVRHALSQADALRAFTSMPQLNEELINDPDSWVARTGTDQLVTSDPHGAASQATLPAPARRSPQTVG